MLRKWDSFKGVKYAGNEDIGIRNAVMALLRISANFARIDKMPFNPNPLTHFQAKLLEAIRDKLIEIRDPDKDVLDDRVYEFYLQNTKKFGPIPKIRFKPNALDIKQEIMIKAGYTPVTKKLSYKMQRNASASAFDKHWDAMMSGLIKSAKRIALFNQTFALDGQEVSDLIKLIQSCISPGKAKGSIHNPDDERAQRDSFIEKLRQME